MSFINVPGFNKGFGKNNIAPAIGPQVKPQLMVANQPNQAQIRSNVSANMNQANSSSKTSGGRIGGRKKGRRANDKPNSPIIPFMKNYSKDSTPKNTLTVNNGDFGYDIGGTNTPASFNSSRDQTLFRDYNIISRKEGSDKAKLIANNVTNSIKSLDIGLTDCLSRSGSYTSAFSVIYNIIYRDVAANTRGAAGALSAIDDNELRNYLDKIVRAFDFLIELETLQAWDPSDNSMYDRSLRKLASLASTTTILETRTKLRQALIPHVLPSGWMKYLRWIRETHLAGPVNESNKLRFCSPAMIELMDALTKGGDISAWTTLGEQLANTVEVMSPKIPAIITSNVTSIPFSNCKDQYSEVFKGASYDPEFCNVFNNRTIQWEFNGTGYKYPSILSSETHYAAFNSLTPYSLALANLSTQSTSSGLPLETLLTKVAVSDQAIKHSSFFIQEPSLNTFKIRGVERWYESSDDATHTVDINTNGDHESSISMPRNSETSLFVAAKSNIDMAQRESMSSITMGA